MKKIKEEADERKYYLTDPANVMGMGKITNFKEESKYFEIMGFKFLRDNDDLKVLLNLPMDEVIEIHKGDKKWAKISKEYYDIAQKIIDIWGGSISVFVSNKKDSPVLIAGDDLGFVLAPRIERED